LKNRVKIVQANKDEIMKIAIIGGSGKMGRWLANFLVKEGQEVIITGRNEKKLLEAKQQLGVEASTSIEVVKDTELIIISVPIDNFEGVVQQLQPRILPEHIIMDTTSIKATPVEIMHKYFDRGLVLGAHPMFGPGAKGVHNQNFVLTPTDEKEATFAQKIKQYLEARGAKVSLMTPQEHDELIAVILGLAHFIAIVSADTLVNLGRLKEMQSVSGTTYKVLLMLIESVLSEDPELYSSLQMNIPEVIEMEELFQISSKRWADMVKSKDKQEFIKRMTVLKDKLEKADPDFGKAYENMYRLTEDPQQ